MRQAAGVHVPEPHLLVGAPCGDPGAVVRERDAPDVVGLSVGPLDRAGLAGLQIPEPDRPVRVTRDQHLAVVREGQAQNVRGIFLGVLQARPPRFARRRILEVDDGAFPALWIGSAPRGEDPSVRGEGQGPYPRPFPSRLRPVERPRHPAGRGIPEGDLSPVLLWVEDQGGHGLPVRGRRQVPDGAPQRQRPDHRVPGLLGKPPEDMPLEAAPVRLIGFGDVATEQLVHLLDVAGLPRLLDREQIRGVKVAGHVRAAGPPPWPRGDRPEPTGPC